MAELAYRNKRLEVLHKTSAALLKITRSHNVHNSTISRLSAQEAAA
jgi:hypothetical protein